MGSKFQIQHTIRAAATASHVGPLRGLTVFQHSLDHERAGHVARSLGQERSPTTPPPRCAANPLPTASQPDQFAGALQIRRGIIGSFRGGLRAAPSSYPPKPKPQRGDETSRGFGASHEGRSLQKGPSTNTIIHFGSLDVRAVDLPWLTSLSGSPRVLSSSMRPLNALPAEPRATSQEGTRGPRRCTGLSRSAKLLFLVTSFQLGPETRAPGMRLGWGAGRYRRGIRLRTNSWKHSPALPTIVFYDSSLRWLEINT